MIKQNKKDYFKLLTDLKKKNSNLKVMLSVGSFRDGTTPFLKFAQSNQKRRDFIRNVVAYLRALSFDGLEINWSIRNIDEFLYANNNNNNNTNDVVRLMAHFMQVFFSIANTN